MSKILVTGNAGSGKSSVAKKLARTLNHPLYGMDSIVWKENWKKTTSADRSKQVAAIIEQESWVIDGVDDEVMKAADIVIFLDVPRRVSYWRVLKRNKNYLFKSRPGLPAKCPEILIIPTLVKIIWRFPSRVRPKILAEKASREGTSFVHVRKWADLERYLRLFE